MPNLRQRKQVSYSTTRPKKGLKSKPIAELVTQPIAELVIQPIVELVTQPFHPPTLLIEPLNESMEKMNISDNLDLHLDKSAEEAEAETEGGDVNEEESMEENQGQVKKRLVYKKIKTFASEMDLKFCFPIMI